MRPLVIAHISDLHIGSEHRPRNSTNARRLLEYIVRRGVDHVVLTGDITANAGPVDFAEARRILEPFGLLNPARLTVVIGNHDVFGGVQVPEDILGFPRRCKETTYERKVEEFREHFREAFQNSFFTSPFDPFPFAKMIGNVLLVGINTVAPYSRIRNPLGSNGEVGSVQFRRLETILGADVFQKRKKIILAHHHFSRNEGKQPASVNSVWGTIENQTMRLHGKKPLCRLFRSHGVEIVLHGHVHRNAEYRRKGVRFLNGGGSVLGPGLDELNVNMLRVSDREVEVEIHCLSDAKARKREFLLPPPVDGFPAHVVVKPEGVDTVVVMEGDELGEPAGRGDQQPLL